MAVQVLEHVALLAAVENGSAHRGGLRAAAPTGMHPQLLRLQRVVTAAGGDLRCAAGPFCLTPSLAPAPLHSLTRALPAQCPRPTDKLGSRGVLAAAGTHWSTSAELLMGTLRNFSIFVESHSVTCKSDADARRCQLH